MFEKFAEDVEKRYWQKLAWMANRHIYGFSAWENFEEKPEGMKKMSSKKVLRNWDKLSPEEQLAIRNSLGDKDIVYLDSKPLGQGWEGAAYRVLTKDLGEAIRKNFNGCYGEPSHLDRQLELKGDLLGKDIIDNIKNNNYAEAYKLYTAGNSRRKMMNRLEERMQVLMNPDNQELFATLSKAQPRKVREMIGGGLRSDKAGLGGIVMEKLNIPEDTSELTEADFAAMNSEFAQAILKAHAADVPAFGTDFPEHFTTPNGKIGPNMRFAPILRGADGKLYQVKDLRNVYDPSVLPKPPFGGEFEPAFHNVGLNSEGKLKIFDFGTKLIEED